jgi:hypothetical protein
MTRRLFERGPDDLLVEVPYDTRGDRSVATTVIQADILFTPAQEATREAAQLAAREEMERRQQAESEVLAGKEQRKAAARAKVEALGLTEDDLRALLG